MTSSIYTVVKKIPKGKVATYGQVALIAGNRNMARVVGNALHHNPEPGIIPCHRVVNYKGKLSDAFAFGGINEQARLLEQEGVTVSNGVVDLKQFQVMDCDLRSKLLWMI